ncbi:sulfite exporter TauE/SafE family protein [Rhodovulum euryhalinum]|uniref:Probable membrane transporter protein n=1 Tax=Rhodovulum euryhalinum TaxID=35805 RepID=A0A4V2SB29_9RHOB|nr:sulfite exporter TauE/SafE family protein [Rhodovulum euryhalinum]TCO73940.1 hypothetical protein EV655_10196 [Rhodovulum euryhalinum]
MDDAVLHLVSSPLLLVALLVIVFAASIVQVGLGLGFGLVAAPLLALLDPALVPVPTLIVGLATASAAALRERAGIDWAEVWTGLWGRVAGVAVASLLLARLADPDTFALVFGAMIGLAVALSALGLGMRLTRRRLVGMAALSGLMGTITSVGAPPMAIVYQNRPGAQARPTLSAFFALGTAMSLGGLWAAGWAGAEDLVLAAIMAPGMVAGVLVSGRLRGRFDARYRAALLAVSGLAALVLILRGLL